MAARTARRRATSSLSKKPTPTRKRWLAYLYLLINTLCWGSLLVVAKPALELTSPASLLLGRFLAVSLTTIPIAVYLIRTSGITWNQIAKICLVEFLGTGIALALLYTGLERTSSLEANVIANLAPLFITGAGVIFLREKLQRHETIGMTIAFLGTLGMVCLPCLINPQNFFSQNVIGDLFIVLHALCVGFYFVAGKRVYEGVNKVLVSILGSYVGVVSFFTMLVFQSGGTRAALTTFAQDLNTPVVADTVLYLAFIGTLVGLTAYIKGQELIEASEASLFFYLQPLVYIPLGYWMLHETVSWPQMALLLVIGLGVFVAEKRHWQS